MSVLRFSCGTSVEIGAADHFQVVRDFNELGLDDEAPVPLPFRSALTADELPNLAGALERVPKNGGNVRSTGFALIIGNFLCADDDWTEAIEKKIVALLFRDPLPDLRSQLGLGQHPSESSSYYRTYQASFLAEAQGVLDPADEKYDCERNGSITLQSPRIHYEELAGSAKAPAPTPTSECAAPRVCDCAKCLRAAYPADAAPAPQDFFDALSRGRAEARRTAMEFESFADAVRGRQYELQHQLFAADQELQLVTVLLEKKRSKPTRDEAELRRLEFRLRNAQTVEAKSRRLHRRHELCRLHLFYTCSNAPLGVDLCDALDVPSVLLRAVALGDWLDRAGAAPSVASFCVTNLMRCVDRFTVSIPILCRVCQKRPPTSFWLQSEHATQNRMPYTKQYISAASRPRLAEFCHRFLNARAWGGECVRVAALCGHCVKRQEEVGGVGQQCTLKRPRCDA